MGETLGFSMVVKRRPAVAGAFYEDDGELLRNRIEWSINHELGPARNPRSIGDPVAVVVPHAGLIYSGPIAAHSYVAIKKRLSPSTFIIMGPNHYGVGAPVAVMNEGGVWETPLGDIEIDSSIANELMKSFEGLRLIPLHSRGNTPWRCRSHSFSTYFRDPR